MSDDNSYDKKMKYKAVLEDKKLKPVKSHKKGKQNMKNSLKDVDIASCREDDFSDIDDYYWGED